MTTEQMVNDVRVVFRDGISAKFGWDLIGPMNRFTEAMAAKTRELQGADESADNVFIPGLAVVQLVHDALGWEAVVLLVRAAVESWDFPGDLTTDECCDDLDTLGELFPLIVKGRQIYLGVPLSGE